MSERAIAFGIIGGGLMGREFASAAARWVHLAPIGARPEIVAVCDPDPTVRAWYERLPSPPRLYADHRDLLADPQVEAVYCAVPHHLHEAIYLDVLASGRHLLGEKPFGIDRSANRAISAAIDEHPELLVRCSSEMPFFPGAQRMAAWIEQRRFGRVIEVRSAFLHSSDLDPGKAINWKRRAETNGASGVLNDLGMHALHMPLRAGWMPDSVTAVLSNVVPTRNDASGAAVACDTWDNASLLCRVPYDGYEFPLHVDVKRIAPGQTNTWLLEIDGTEGSIAFTTKEPKTLRTMAYAPGSEQSFAVTDLGYVSAYPAVTGAIFEFGFSDAVLQMWAAFVDELANGDDMKGKYPCASPQEVAATHAIWDAAMTSQAERTGVSVA